MDKHHIINVIKSAKHELVNRYGVKKVGLFGSYVRHQEEKFSDVDIIVSFSREIDLFDFIDLREFLEKKLQAKVDLVMDSALKPSIGKRIRKEAEYV